MAEQTKTRVIQSTGDPGKWQAQYYNASMDLWFDLGDAQDTKEQAEQRRRFAHTTPAHTLSLNLSEYDLGVLLTMLRTEQQRAERDATTDSPWGEAIARIAAQVNVGER